MDKAKPYGVYWPDQAVPGITTNVYGFYSPNVGTEDTMSADPDIDSFESPESSNIVRAQYNKVTQQMIVIFKRERAQKHPELVPPPEIQVRYAYEEITLAQWLDFATAKSKGEFFAANIRPLFSGRKL